MGIHNANRVTTLNTPQGNLAYVFDNASRRTSMTDSSGTTSYTYDNSSHLKTVTNPFSEVTTWTYDGVGRVTKQLFSNGQYETCSYNDRNFQTYDRHFTAAAVSISTEAYTYEANGNLHTKAAAGVTTTYGYDAINQLSSESRTGYSAVYTYDANGNRATKTLGGVTETYHVDDGDKLTSVTNGATTVKSFGYDAAGRTTSVTTSAGTTTLSYDYEDRISNIVYPSSATNTFTYNGLDTRVGKTDSTGTATYRRDGVGVTAPVLSDGSADYTPGISQRRSGTTTYDLTDFQGSATRQTSTSSVITGTRSFDAFGLTLGTSGSIAGPFGFASGFGYQEDSDSGLQLLGHRYYDASTGRFLTKDPAKDGRNWYSYCGNNPLIYVDPTGFGRDTWLYRMVDETGKFIKWGISYTPERRYTKKWLRDHSYQVERIACYEDRSIALQDERMLATEDPGDLNQEPWAKKTKAIRSLIGVLKDIVEALDPTPISGGMDAGKTAGVLITPWVEEKKAERERALHSWLEDE